MELNIRTFFCVRSMIIILMIHRGALLVSMSHDFGNCEPHQNILDLLIEIRRRRKRIKKSKKNEDPVRKCVCTCVLNGLA